MTDGGSKVAAHIGENGAWTPAEKIDQVEVKESFIPVSYNYTQVREVLGKTEWFWPSWVPRGYVTIMAGSPGQGKSIFALQGLVAPMTNPEDYNFPDGAKHQLPEGQNPVVLWIESEGSQQMNAERIVNMGLNGNRVMGCRCPDEGTDILAQVFLDNDKHWAAILHFIETYKPALVVVDALLGSHSGDERKSRDIQKLFMKLAVVARDKRIAVVVVDHLRKSKDGEEANVVSHERVRDSSAKLQYVRSGIGIDWPDPTGSRRAHVIKFNLTKPPTPLGFDFDELGLLEWTDAPEPPRKIRLVEEAAEWLKELLRDEPRMTQDIEDLGAQHSPPFMKRTLERAKTKAKIISRRLPGKATWYWTLPDWAEPTLEGEDETV